MKSNNYISIITELYGNRGLCWNEHDGYQSFILIQKQSELVIGDRVICNELISNECTIEKIIEPNNSLKKMSSNGLVQNIANNVTNTIFVLSSQPKPNYFLLDKLILIAETNQCKISILINKSDLEYSSLKNELLYYETLGYPITVVSAKEDINKDGLIDILRNETSILLGQSGVGKSTLINWLLSDVNITTNTLSQKGNRGRHTTSTTKLHILNPKSLLFDTPGMENLHPNILSKFDVQAGFKEILSYRESCKYRDCLHVAEPKCAVKEFLSSSAGSTQRYNHYLKIVESIS